MGQKYAFWFNNGEKVELENVKYFTPDTGSFYLVETEDGKRAMSFDGYSLSTAYPVDYKPTTEPAPTLTVAHYEIKTREGKVLYVENIGSLKMEFGIAKFNNHEKVTVLALNIKDIVYYKEVEKRA